MRNYRKIVYIALFLICLSGTAMANTKTQIKGEFNGCDFGKLYELTNGQLLECQGYEYSYSYSPDVIFLNNGEALIDGERYDATMVSGRVIETHVNGDFEGCDFDKMIPMQNGLLFECRTYHYHYAYSPEVKIFIVGSNTTVTIDNEVYAGVLYKQ